MDSRVDIAQPSGGSSFIVLSLIKAFSLSLLGALSLRHGLGTALV